MKVLISAYACEPNKGSEPGVGWHWVNELHHWHEVWVITRRNNQAVIQQAYRGGSPNSLHFEYYDLPAWMSSWKRGKRFVHLYYLIWQLGTLRLAKKITKREKIELVHHLTFGSALLPTFLYIVGLPFIWGPIGGCELVPWNYLRDWPWRAKMKEMLRGALVGTLRANPLFRLAACKAEVILAKTNETAKCLERFASGKVLLCSDVAGESKLDAPTSATKGKLQILCVGTLEAWRGYDMALEAFALIADEVQEAALVLIGDGPERARLQRIAVEKGLEERVIFKGSRSYSDYIEDLSNSDIVVNTCLREGGVTVLYDAMAAAVPLICMDNGSASDLIKQGGGFLITMGAREHSVQEIATALRRLLNNREVRRRLGQSGRAMINQSKNWNQKAQEIQSLYANIGTGSV